MNLPSYLGPFRTGILSFLVLVLLLTRVPGFPSEREGLVLSLGSQTSLLLSGIPGKDPGLGGSLSFEWRPQSAWSLGGELGLSAFVGGTGPVVWASRLDVIGRFLPLGLASGPSPFLIGGGGLDPRIGTNAWDGLFHGFLGAGAWLPLEAEMALDLSVTYDVHSPLSAPLESIGLRLGLSFFSDEPFLSPEERVGMEPDLPRLEPTPTPIPASSQGVTLELESAGEDIQVVP